MRIQLIAKQKEIRECQLLKIEVRDPTTWTILQKYGPNHLGLRYNALNVLNRGRPSRPSRTELSAVPGHAGRYAGRVLYARPHTHVAAAAIKECTLQLAGQN